MQDGCSPAGVDFTALSYFWIGTTVISVSIFNKCLGLIRFVSFSADSLSTGKRYV